MFRSGSTDNFPVTDIASCRILWISANPDPPTGWNPPPGWNIHFQAPEPALRALAVAEYSVVVMSLPVPGWPAVTLLDRVRCAAPSVPVMAYDPAASIEGAVTLAHLGVRQCL